ncbi:GNAT family N-acetyltransferase [Pseudooceanicola sp. HF7]|uniref:GNAT family N-acetyltransferase n=1 Tax=Pseudooceanicola sp. HF7 TaxID=2721560 RepID=UPI00143042A9|nr:GNAT family N-acetyltransferase [Pseudooceanicola sp. HF7]NIZ09496.1 GNAT family N-acetyltransferase [Pseudooceanicola sp. HF7]
MTSTFNIMRAGLNDIPELIPLYERFFAEDAIKIARPEIEANLRQMLADDRASVFVATANGSAIGLASASLTCGVEFGWAAEIEDLFVVPERRGQGLARQLIELVLEWADDSGVRQSYLVITPEAEHAQSLTALYSKFGFVRSNRVLMYRAS